MADLLKAYSSSKRFIEITVKHKSGNNKSNNRNLSLENYYSEKQIGPIYIYNNQQHLEKTNFTEDYSISQVVNNNFFQYDNNIEEEFQNLDTSKIIQRILKKNRIKFLFLPLHNNLEINTIFFNYIVKKLKNDKIVHKNAKIQPAESGHIVSFRFKGEIKKNIKDKKIWILNRILKNDFNSSTNVKKNFASIVILSLNMLSIMDRNKIDIDTTSTAFDYLIIKGLNKIHKYYTIIFLDPKHFFLS